MKRALPISIAILVFASVSLTPVSAAPTTASKAKDYQYPIHAEDPANDQQAIITGPNTANPENDMLAFDMTDDDTSIIMRVNMSTMTFGAAAGTVTVTLGLSTKEDDWEATVIYETGGKNVMVADYDSVPPAAGDSDLLLPGVRAEILGNSLYVIAPHSSTKLALNSTVNIDEVSCGRGMVTFSNGMVDEVETPRKYVLIKGAFGNGTNNATKNDTKAPEEKTPGFLAPAAVAAAFLAAAVWSRRREHS